MTAWTKKITLAALILLFAVSRLWASVEDAGTASPFSLGAGGRIISMGGAGTSLKGSSFLLRWNPASLSGIERGEISLFHTSLFDPSVTYTCMYGAYPFLDLGVLSAGAVQLRVGGIERRDSENMILTDDLSNVQTRYMLAYSKRVYRGLAAGISMKLDRYAQGPYLANGLGIDAGLSAGKQIDSPYVEGVSAGFALENIVEPKITLVSEESGDPRGFRAGASLWRGIIEGTDDRILVAADISKTRYSEVHFHLGLEYSLRRMFAVRAGWDRGIPTFGCGFAAAGFTVDYAYRSTELGGNHLFSLIYNFGSSRSDRLEQRRELRARELKNQLEHHIDKYEKNFISSAMREGRQQLHGGNYRKAIELFRKVLLWSPDNAEARDNLQIAEASLSIQQGDSLASREHYGEALFLYRKAYRFLKKPEIADKISRYEQKIAETTDKRKMINQLFSRGLEFFTSRKWNDAEKAFNEVLALDSSHELASEYLERTRQRMAQARKRLLREAETYKSRKNYAAAINVLRKGLRSFPADREMERRIEELQSLMKMRESEKKAERERSRRTASRPSRDEMNRLRTIFEEGIDFFNRGKFALAVSRWEKVHGRYATFENVDDYLIRAYLYLGMQYYAHQKYQKALDAWEKILDIRSGHAKALRYINRTREELYKLRGLTD